MLPHQSPVRTYLLSPLLDFVNVYKDDNFRLLFLFVNESIIRNCSHLCMHAWTFPPSYSFNLMFILKMHAVRIITFSFPFCTLTRVHTWSDDQAIPANLSIDAEDISSSITYHHIPL